MVTLVTLVLFADVQHVYKLMNHLEKLSKTLTDILDCRIEAVLGEMSATALCDIPEQESVTADKFIQLTTDIVKSASESLSM